MEWIWMGLVERPSHEMKIFTFLIIFVLKCFEGYTYSSATGFGKILPLWQKFTSLWQIFDSLFLIWQNAEPTLSNL